MSEQQPVVMKFGGTSVEDAAAFRRVAEIVGKRRDLRPVVVVSAMSGMTDALLESVNTAIEFGTQAAAASLVPHFARHVAVADALLTTEESDSFTADLKHHEVEIEGCLIP